MSKLLLSAGALLAILVLLAREPGATAEDTKKAKDGKGWVQLFNGKDLTGWKVHPKEPGNWQVKDGILIGRGKDRSHLFSERGDYENFVYRIEAKISDKGNSGQYIRAQYGPGYPKGYEIQINATHTDPIRTGSLYPSFPAGKAAGDKIIVREQLHKPDEWFTQEVTAIGNHLVVKLNGKTTVDFVDPDNTYTSGHFAMQQHPPAKGSDESIIQVRKIEVKELPPTKKSEK